MKRKTKTVKYTDEPMEGVRVTDDFLPPPGQLVFKEPQVKVTLTLSKRSLEFFKDAANREHVGYQAMIRSVLDIYTDRFGA